jgi:serine/threonine protein kinase
MSQIKQILDEYRLVGVMTTSVRTTVFQATDPRNDARVVIKLINPAGPVAEEVNRSRFLQVLQAAQSGVIRALPRTLDFGFTPEGSAFLVAELVDPAVPMASLAGGPPSELVPLLAGLLDAVDELAMAGIAHLNLSPGNVLVTQDTVRLVGFGSGAYLVGAPSGIWPTEGARYAAPELYGRGVLRRNDLWLADVYSVALIACDMLGIEVEELGGSQPRVIPPGGGSESTREFESMAAAALRGDPRKRTVTVSDLRRALVEGEFVAVEGDVAPPDTDKTSVLEAAGIPLPSELTEADVAIAASEDSDHGGVQQTVVLPAVPPDTSTGEGAEDPTQKTIRIDMATAVPQAEPDPNADTKPSIGGPSRPPVPWLLVAAALGSVVLLMIVSMIGSPVWKPEPEPVVEPVAVAPTATPIPPPTPFPEVEEQFHPLLFEAENHLIEGDLDGARATLEALSDEEVANLDAAELQLYEELMAAVESTDWTAALKDLRGGLAAGSIKMLRRGTAGLSGMSREEIADEPGLRRDLDHARSALKTHERMWTAKKNGDHEAILEQSKAMISLLPDYSGSYSLRDGAATELEARAENAISQRDFGAALVQLESVHRYWPDRSGLVERMEWCRLEQAGDRRLQETLDRALEAGRGGNPQEGLRILAGDSPNATFAGRFAEAQKRFEQQIAGLDAQPPEILLPPDFNFAFKKDTTVVVPITVTDDFRVRRVVVFVKGKSDASFREIELRPVSQGLYRFEATPAVHGNAKLFFYVVATDQSGHQSTLGDAAQPLQLDRKRWYKK